MRYRLNFKGFTDARETLFVDASSSTVSEALAGIDFSNIDHILTECINTIKTKLGIVINKNSIEDIQFYNQVDFAAQLMITGQDRYLLLVNTNKINTEDELVSTVYHELCHVYQLNKLFTEKLMAYDYFINDVSAMSEEAVGLLQTHLNINGGHTKYWQELADKINTMLNPAVKISAYLNESIENIRAEFFEEDYFRVDFDGFYDTTETLFGRA